MTPLKLTLKGFKGVLAGLGRHEVALDFTQYGDGLIALVGPNGSAKSTLLDNMHPYRVMPSRAGGSSPESFSYYDETHAPEAAKELEWSHGGATYRSTILIKQTPKTRKQECYLHMREGDEWVAYAAPGLPLFSDGKAESYDRCVEHILGSPTMFFTAAFASQGRRSLSDYRGADIKALFSELLDLDHLREIGARANTVSKTLRMRFEGMQFRLLDLQKAQSMLDEARASVAVARTDQDARNARLVEVRADLERAIANEMRVREAEAAITTTLMRRRDMEAQIARNNAQCEAAIGELARMVREPAQAAFRSRNAELNEREAVLTRALDALRRRMEGLRKTVDLSASVAAAAERVGRLTEAANAATERQEQARAMREAKNAADAAVREIDAKINGLRNAGQAAAQRLEDLQRRAGLIKTVACAGMPALEGTCPLLGDARAALEGIAPAAAELERLRDEYAEAVRERLDAGERARDLAESAIDLQAASAELSRVLAELKTATELAAKAEAVEQARVDLAAALDEHNEATRSLHAIAVERGEAERLRAQQLDDVDRQINAKHEERRKANDAIMQALIGLPAVAGSGMVEDVAFRRAEIQAAVDAAIEQSAQDRARIATIEAEIARLEDGIKEGAQFAAVGKALSDEIAQWTLLARAFGNEGVIALSIDDAGPTLSNIANELLTSCYGPRFSLSITTQAETAKGDLREAMDVIVFDADRGDKKSVRQMSGGERVWINECLTRALALYRGAQVSGTQYETLFADETDGALDPERKRAYMKMKRAELALSGAKREFFITHTEALWNEADATIFLEDFRVSA